MSAICKPLNCPLCVSPYTITPGDEHTPIQTNCHNVQAMCMKCYKGDEAKKRHKCSGGWKCSSYNVYPSHYLIELLADECFAFDADQKGYVMKTRAMPIPKCSICRVKYSLDDSSKEPFALCCGHTICNGCFDRTAVKDKYKHKLKCPQCLKDWWYLEKSWENPLKALLRELQEHERVSKNVEEPKKPAENLDRSCDDCKKEFSLFEMFQCNDCNKMLCSLCAMKAHRQHNINDLSTIEVNRMREETLATITPQIKAYNASMPQLQNDLIKNIGKAQKEIINKVAKIVALNYSQASQKKDKCLKLGDKFESICKKIMTDLEERNAEIEKLLIETREVTE